jgi:hypothetical protein
VLPPMPPPCRLEHELRLSLHELASSCCCCRTEEEAEGAPAWPLAGLFWRLLWREDAAASALAAGVASGDCRKGCASSGFP